MLSQIKPKLKIMFEKDNLRDYFNENLETNPLQLELVVY